jgi:hypothetical protein
MNMYQLVATAAKSRASTVHKLNRSNTEIVGSNTVRGMDVYPFFVCFSGIAQCYSAGLWSGRSMVRVPVGARNVSPHHCVQAGSGAHPASYQMDTRRSFPRGKAARG